MTYGVAELSGTAFTAAWTLANVPPAPPGETFSTTAAAGMASAGAGAVPTETWPPREGPAGAALAAGAPAARESATRTGAASRVAAGRFLISDVLTCLTGGGERTLCQDGVSYMTCPSMLSRIARFLRLCRLGCGTETPCGMASSYMTSEWLCCSPGAVAPL